MADSKISALTDGVTADATDRFGVARSDGGGGWVSRYITPDYIKTYLGLWSGTSGGIPYYDSTTTLASSALLAANAVVLGGGAGTAPFTDGTNLLFTTASGPRLQVGSGTGTSAGFILGYEGTNSSYSAIWHSGVTPSASNYSFRLNSNGTNVGVIINSTGTGVVDIGNANVVKMRFANTAGLGPLITAGTATTDVSALSLTQTWNASGVTFTGIKYTITDTASAAGSLAMQILGGASGTTELFSVGKSGDTTIGSNGGNSNIKGLGTYTWLWVNGNRAAGVVDTGSIRPFLVGTAADLGLYNAGSGVLRVMDGGSATNYRDLQARIYKNPGIAFASLPTAAAGDIAYITDSTTATWGATIAGGGANPVLGWYNGTNWTVAGA